MTMQRIQLLPVLLLAAVAITLSLTGCSRSFKRFETLFPTGGGPGALMYVADPLGASGEASITLPDGVVLEGEWAEVGGATNLQAVLVATPNGVISAADLAGLERPKVITTLRGHGIEMICVYIGDPQSDYKVTCADSRGDRWVDRRATQWGFSGAVR